MTSGKTAAVRDLMNLATDRAAPRAFWLFTFALLTAAGAQLEIPHSPVPFTAQTLFVLLAGGLLGARNGMLSMLLYLVLGSVGLPVFSGFSFGLARLFGPTGGYLMSFPAAAFLIGSLIQRRSSFGWILLSMSFGLLVVFSAGMTYLQLFFLHDWTKAFNAGVMIFSWWDVAKLLAAASITHQYYTRMRART